MQLHQLLRRVSLQLRSTPLVESIVQGKAHRGQYRAYLSDAYYYTQHSAHLVAHAGIRLAAFQPRLSAYMAHRAARRLAHHPAAQADLRDLGLTEEDFSVLRPSSPCLRMVALQYFYAKEDNPVGVLGWMFAMQGLGGEVGPGVAVALDRCLDLKGSALRFLSANAASNRNDITKLSRFLEASAFDADDGECFVRSVNETLDLYCGMLDVAFATGEPPAGIPRAVVDLRRRLH